VANVASGIRLNTKYCKKNTTFFFTKTVHKQLEFASERGWGGVEDRKGLNHRRLERGVPGKTLLVELNDGRGHSTFASRAGTRSASSDPFHLIKNMNSPVLEWHSKTGPFGIQTRIEFVKTGQSGFRMVTVFMNFQT
jgi:hypothetical protein